MTVIYSPFLREILNTHDLLAQNTFYPFFDPACRRYEAIRSALVDRKSLSSIFETLGITEYQYRQALAAFRKGGVASRRMIPYIAQAHVDQVRAGVIGDDVVQGSDKVRPIALAIGAVAFPAPTKETFS